MYKNIVKSVKAGSYLGALPSGECAGLTGECALKGKKENGGVRTQGHEC